EWVAAFEGVDACVEPVLDVGEAAEDSHNRARDLFVDVAGIAQPAPAPRFSETPGTVTRPPARPGEDTRQALETWGFSAAEVDRRRLSASPRSTPCCVAGDRAACRVLEQLRAFAESRIGASPRRHNGGSASDR